ncbi:MAG: hypothetical protein ACRD97_11305 [Nitrososphaeraceae archaeon]
MTESIIERYIKILTVVKFMQNSKRDVYVCFYKEEILLLEEYAREKGALNISQALELLISNTRNEN